jgi:hypothetical protein
MAQWPGLEADQSPSSSDIENVDPYVSMVWCLIKHKENFTLTFLHTSVVASSYAPYLPGLHLVFARNHYT